VSRVPLSRAFCLGVLSEWLLACGIEVSDGSKCAFGGEECGL